MARNLPDLSVSTYVPLLHNNHNLAPTWSPVDSFWDSKRPNLIPDHIIQLLLQLCRGFGALSQDHVCVNALPLDVVVHPVSNSETALGLAGLAHVSALSHTSDTVESWYNQ